MAIEIAFETSVDVGEGAQSLKALKKEFKEAQNELDGLTVGSDKYIASLKRLGKIKDDIGDLNTTIKAFNPEGKIKAFQTVVGGLASGFQAATGAAALFGGESKDLEKALLKVQAVMAFTEGIKGVVALGDGFKVLWAVIKANPVSAIIAGLAALAAGAIALYESLDKTSEATKRLTKESESQKEITSQLIGVTTRHLALLTAQGASEAEIAKVKKEVIAQQIREVEIGIQLHQSKVKDILANDNLTESYYRLQAAIFRKMGAIQTAETFEKIIQANKQDRAKEDIDAILKAKEDLLNFKNSALVIDTELTTSNKKKNDEIKKSNEDGLNSELINIQNKTKELNPKIAAENKAAKEKETDELLAIEERAWDRRDRMELNRTNALHEYLTMDSVNGLNETLALLEFEKKAELSNKEITEVEKVVIEKKYRDKERAARLKDADDKLAAAENTVKSLQILSDLYFDYQLKRAKGNSAQELEIRKKQFKINKAFQLAQTAIEGARSVISASSMTPYFYVGLSASIVASIATTAALAKIASTQFEGGEAVSSSSSLATTSSPNTSAPPTVNAPTSGNTQLNPDGTLRSANVTQQQPTVRAIVVETDMTTTQRRVSTIEERSKI